MVICFFNELIWNLSVGIPEGEDVVDITFPNERFNCTLAKDFCFDFAHKNIGKCDSHFGAHGGSMCLWVILTTKLEQVFL